METKRMSRLRDPKDGVRKEEVGVNKEMSSGKAAIIFIALSAALLIGIGSLPKSVPVLPASVSASAAVKAP
ncbi:exported hypothetical protein [Candidatus Desulfosporosinus infrequens]|uniref:Uncharacterized protein n=1 Tax=Candidatus Desulfosporosinus infrequens TaxID=2043169 RepID=A0A2U3K3R1_9FIRM|nr:exported hypothetical protein [Candidatus Desulfosporosinus infrequens]